MVMGEQEKINKDKREYEKTKEMIEKNKEIRSKIKRHKEGINERNEKIEKIEESITYVSTYINGAKKQIKMIGIEEPRRLRINGEIKRSYILNTFNIEEEYRRIFRDENYTFNYRGIE